MRGKQALVDEMIDDHIHLLHIKKQQCAIEEEIAMATMMNHHDVPMEIMMVPMAMDPVDVDKDYGH